MALTKCRECGRRISKKARVCPGCGATVKRNSSNLALGCVGMMGLFTCFLCAGIIGIGQSVSDNQKESSPSRVEVNSSNNSVLSSAAPSQGVLDGVDFTIINDDTVHNIKRSLDIRLGKKVSKDQLQALAIKLKSEDPQKYERTFICYYLPGMIIDSGAWATTHFNPELEVRILGLTTDEENKLRQLPSMKPPGYLGSWFIDDGRRVSIYKKNGVFYMQTMFSDGSKGEDQLAEKQYEGGRKFVRVKYSDPMDDFYVIDQDSNLQHWSSDVDGTHVLYKTAEKLN